MVKVSALRTIALAAVLAATFGLVSCQRPAETPKSDEVSRIISAMSHGRTFTLASTVTDNYTVVDKTDRTTKMWRWEGQADIDLANNAAHVSMTAADMANPALTLFRWEQYVLRGWEYYNQTTPGGAKNPWSRVKPDGGEWESLLANSAQVAPLVELLNTAPKVEAAGFEVIDGLNCDVINMSLTAGAAADWVLSQDRGGSGPGMGWWRSGPERSKEIYAEAYTGGSARFWIDRDSSRIVQVDVDLHFVVLPGNAKRSDTPMLSDSNSSETDLGSEEIARDFHGELYFSSYGRSVRIVVPPEGVNAPTRY